MLIKKLILHNFRQFIETQEISFSTDKEKNVTVLIGINTSGKTTLIRAFEWILYNKNEFDDKILLNKNVAGNMQAGDTQAVRGTLVLEHNGKEYEISRKQIYTCTGSGVRPSSTTADILYLQPDGQTKTRLGSEFSSNIERILPKALSNYFFFGGERIGSISSREDIESSVKGLMGLDVLYNAMAHLRSVINKLKKSMDFSGDQQAADAQKMLEDANRRKKEYENELANIGEQIEYYQAEKEKYAALLRANEETAAEQRRREQLDAVIKGLVDRIEKDKKSLVSAFSRNAFAFFSLPLLQQSAELLNQMGDETESVPEMSGASIDYILKRGTCICGTCISEGSAAEKHLLAERSKQPPESIGSLVRRYREQAMDYISSSEDYYSSIEERFMSLRSNQRELGFLIDEKKALDERLKGAKDVSELEKNYQAAAKRREEFEQKKTDLIEVIGVCKKDIENAETTLDAFGEDNQKNARITLNIEYATAVLEWIAEAYKARESTVRRKLEERVNANFSLMYHGSRTVTIDERYRVKYIDVTTEESDGLKVVKSFAFVSGLIDLAKEALISGKTKKADIGPQYYPLVMDAPFSNVDETHIKNISKILPASAEQVIIAVMQKDWEPASEIMAPVVGYSYRIEKDLDADGKEIDTITHIKKVASDV